MIVWLNACPMCSVPVTFGGGSWIENAGSPVRASPVPRWPALAKPRCSHHGPQRDSMGAGSNDLDRRSRPGWAVLSFMEPEILSVVEFAIRPASRGRVFGRQRGGDAELGQWPGYADMRIVPRKRTLVFGCV